jgi:ketopantoate reductase
VSGVRTVIVTLPVFWRDLINQLSIDRVSLDIVAEFNVRSHLARDLQVIQPDLVIIGLRHNETERVIRRMLAVVPATKFIAFLHNGRTILGFELRLQRKNLADAPPYTLIEFIRRACESDLT